MVRIFLLLSLLLCVDSVLAQGVTKEIRVGDVTFNMVYVEGGSFMMGAAGFNDNDYSGCDADEAPCRADVKTFYIGQTEVTQELWKAVMVRNAARVRKENHPVEWVSFDDCLDFIGKLNSMTGMNFRLPTEAEWEWAARGGVYSKGYRYSGSNDLDSVAWYDMNTLLYDDTKHHEVAQKKPNELGIYDMTGNVCEWCQDYYVDRYGTKDPLSVPSNLARRSIHVIRGGSYHHPVEYMRLSNRDVFIATSHYYTVGLRLALDL